MGPALNPLMTLGNDAASVLGHAASDILTEGSADRAGAAPCFASEAR